MRGTTTWKERIEAVFRNSTLPVLGAGSPATLAKEKTWTSCKVLVFYRVRMPGLFCSRVLSFVLLETGIININSHTQGRVLINICLSYCE